MSAEGLAGPTPRVAPPLTQETLLLGLAAASLAMITGAFYFEVIEGLAPCPLCHSQRIAYYIAGPAALLGALAPRLGLIGADWRPIFLLASGAALGVGTYFAGYHAAVERGLLDLPATCAPAGGVIQLSLDMAAEAFTDAVKPARCDEIPWSWLGISMAGYNFLISGALAAVSIGGLLRLPAGPGR